MNDRTFSHACFSRVPLLSALVAALCSAGIVQADEPVSTRTAYSFSIYQGQGVDHNLRDLPGSIVTGDVDWEQTYFSAVGFSRIRGILSNDFPGLQGSVLGPIRHGYELVVVQHYGLQSNAEIGAAWTVRTPDAFVGPVGVNFAAGVGLSYALGSPKYEDGPADDPEKRYRLQLLALFELEWIARSYRQISFVTRIHHRSGAYGVIAPPQVGSNFLAAGIRFSL